MTDVLVGAASWTDRSLVKSGWYPKGTSSAEERLRFYASRFPLVEVDSTYYFLPGEQVVAAWKDRTPKGFTFNVKAFSLLTQHPTRRDAVRMAPEGKQRVYLRHLEPAAVDEIWERFTGVVAPLRRAHKLGTLLFQFPPWFTLNRANKDYVLECAERAAPLPICVELRNETWFREDNFDETMEFFRSHHLPLVSVDTPRGGRSSVPPLDHSSSRDLALIRLHGRGMPRTGITRQAAAGAYLYPRRVLETWVPRVRDLAGQARAVHVVFRNAYRDYAVRNAAQFERLLEQHGLDVRRATGDDRAHRAA